MKYKSEIFEVIHQGAVEMFKIGAISAARMREYDQDCLVQEPETVSKTAEPVKMNYTSRNLRPLPRQFADCANLGTNK
jgi:putative transcriptional regulator